MSTQAMTPEDVRPMLTPAEAALLANVSTKTIYREVERGSLRALRVGGRLLRIEPTDFRHWLEGGNRMRLGRVAPRDDGPVASAPGPCRGGRHG